MFDSVRHEKLRMYATRGSTASTFAKTRRPNSDTESPYYDPDSTIRSSAKYSGRLKTARHESAKEKNRRSRRLVLNVKTPVSAEVLEKLSVLKHPYLRDKYTRPEKDVNRSQITAKNETPIP